MDKGIKHDDDYTITVDEIKESELPVENEPLETTEEASAIIQEKDERPREEVSINAATSEQSKQSKRTTFSTMS